MKKKNISKKVLAVLLSFVILVTTIPFVIVGAVGTGSYDPAPYWGDGGSYGAANTNFVATLNADGSVSVAFPHANPASTWDTYTAASPAKKSISSYIFTITKLEDDGTRTEIWSENIQNRNGVTPGGGTFTIDTTEGNNYPNTIYYYPGALTSLDTYEADASYDVSIQAVDSDGWVSDKIHTLLTATPFYVINDDFSPNESWVVREMLLFETKGSAQVNANAQSDTGVDGSMYTEMHRTQSQIDYVYNANDLVNVDGQMAGMGYNGSAAYRFWINQSYGKANTPFTFETTWSRTHYDFSLKDADVSTYDTAEVWFYVDLSRVTINKFAFNLSANEKYVGHHRDNTTRDLVSQYGETFSTIAAGGKNEGTITEGIYIQNADGLWESSSMTDGYFTDLSGYKGFVRIPLKYFILQEDQYVTGQISLEEWTRDGCDLPSADDTNLLAYVTKESVQENDKIVTNDGRTLYAEAYSDSASGYGIKINPAGTSVIESIVLYERWETYGTWGDKTINTSINYIAGDVTETVADDGSITYTVNNPINAIEDLVSAGIQVAEWSDASVHKSFYIDQVMFCQKNTGGTFDDAGYVTTDSAIQFTQEGATVNASGTADVGRKMAGFYDRTVQVPKAIAEYIMNYFGEIPSLNDLTAKELVDDIILNYIECFGIAKDSALSDTEKISQAIEKLNALGYTEAYNRYKSAEQFVDYVYSEDAESNYNAVIYFENTVENLPTPEFASHTDADLQETLKQLMAIYETFNLSHFEMLGADAEEKFLELYDLVMGEEVRTGQSIGAYPYIPFNDFETNYTFGQLSDMYYDDYPAYNDSKATDVNSTGNFTTYTVSEVISQAGATSGYRDAGAIGWSPSDYRPTGETLDGSAGTYFSRMDAQITNKGFADSLGATININGSLNSTDSLVMATLSTTYLGTEADTWSNLPGLDLSGIAVSTDTNNGTDAEDVTRYGTGVIPNSFVMYVDFTDVSAVNMNIKFILSDPNGNDVNCYFCGGDISQTPVIYQLDDNGEWEEQKLQASQIDTEGANFSDDGATALCTISPSSLNKLEGYKGFIRIPLSNFRTPKKESILGVTATTGALNLDNIIDDGYKIKQVKLTFWDYTGENAGKQLTIDALGFTYDPACTTRKSDAMGTLNQDNNIDVKNMDEYFGVKTTDSSNFEKMVSTIDPYATEAEFKASYEKCRDAYIALSEYQKGIEEVDYCYKQLLVAKYEALYLDYDTEIVKEQWKSLYTATTDDSGNVTATAAENLLTALGTVSETAKEYSTTEESLLDLYEAHKEDYLTALGFTSLEEAQSVIDMYEKGYHRLSMDDRASISDYDFGRLTNAYNAAQRAVLVNGIIGDVETFKNNIIRIYGLSSHTDDDADRIPDTEDSDSELRTVKYAGTTTDADGNTVNALGYYTDMYTDISIFGKKLLDDDTDVAAAYMNMYDAAEAIHDNSTAITPMAGNTVEGGVVTYERRLEQAYTDVKAKIEAKTVLGTATLNEIEYCLGQYEAFLRRYALVDELNYDYVELALLLPTADLEKADGEQVVLTNSDENPLYKDTANADLTYVAARLNRTVSVYLVTDYKWTQTGGTTYDFGYYSVNGATGTDGTMVYTKLGDYENGVTAALAPEVSIDEAKAKKVPTGNQYEGTVTLMAFDSALITDGVDMSTLEPVSMVEIPVMFVSTNGSNPIFYTVSIPASMEVDWDQTVPEDVSYTVNNASLNGGTLTVGVTDNTGNFNSATNKGELINGDNVLVYTASNFKDTVFATDISTDTKPADVPEITITQDDWDAAAVGEYKTTLTYTVEYDDGTT